MLKGVVVQGLVWESCEAILCSSSKGAYRTTNNTLGEERSGEGLNHITSDVRGQGMIGTA